MKMIRTPIDVYETTRKYRTKRQEHFVVITLDGAHQIIKVHTVTIGLINRTIIHPREVFYVAIKDSSAAIMLVHNHPSGNVEPSPEDIEITKRLKEAGELMGIEVLDHVIIGKNSFYSFLETGKL
jgi:DNA repair protein RadC